MQIKNLLSLLVIALFCFTNQATAQLTFGLKAGANLSTTYGSPEKLNDENIESIALRPGFQAGAFVGIGLTDGLMVMGEVAYEVRNGLKEIDLTIPNPLGGDPVTISTDAENSFHYVNVPILLVVGENNLKFYGGPNFGFLTQATGSIAQQNPLTGDTEVERDYINDMPFDTNGSFINKADVGINLGFMYGLGDAAFIDFRLNHGLTDATNNDYDFSILDGTVSREDSDRNVSVQLSFGYKF